MDDPPDPPEPSAPPDPVPGGPASGPETIVADEPPPPPPPPPAEAAGWRLHRSVRDRKLKGVAAGVAAAADVDVTLVRILFAVAALSGWGILAYVALAVVLKDETVEDPALPLPRDQRRMLRIGLAVAAAFAAIRLFDGWFFLGGGIGLPELLIAAGAAVLWARRDQDRPDPVGPRTRPGAAGDGAGDPGGPDLTATAWPTGPVTPPLGPGVDWRSTGLDLLRLAAAFVAVGAFLALLGVTFLVVVGAVPMRLPFLPAAVGTLGLLALVVAVVRRARPAGLFVSGGALAVAVALAVGLASFPGGAGHRVVAIGPETPLLPRYEHSAGRLLLDLGTVSLEPGEERRVVAKVGTGQLTVIVPGALSTGVEARVGAGTTTLFGRSQSGAGVDVIANHAGEAGAGRLLLELDVGVGQLSVDLAPEPTFEVQCSVPAEAKGDGSDLVTCPHPPRLQSRPMSCSVTLVDTQGEGGAGRAFCRRRGSPAPVIGTFATACSVAGESETATCDPLPRSRLVEIAGFRAAARSVPPTSASPTTATPTTFGGTAAVGIPLACGTPDAAGVRTCMPAPPSTSTTAAATYRCTEDPATRQLACVAA